MIINNHFIITFKPKNPELFKNRRRFSIGANSLSKYLGKNNAQNLIQKINKLEGQTAGFKYTFKYRKMGEIILYGR